MKRLATVLAILAVGVLLAGVHLTSALSASTTESPQQKSGSQLGTPPSDASSPFPSEITVKVKSDQGAFPWKDLVLTGATVAVAGISLYLSFRLNKRTLLQKAYEDEMKDIQAKLNSFYGPFRQLLGTSARLYDEFKSRQPDPANFRTLTALLGGTRFTGNDKILLEEIIKITQELDRLIVSKSELIDESLQAALWEASTHFRLIRLAYDNSLSGEADRFQKFVYPRALNDAIDQEIQRLRQRLKELRGLIAS